MSQLNWVRFLWCHNDLVSWGELRCLFRLSSRTENKCECYKVRSVLLFMCFTFFVLFLSLNAFPSPCSFCELAVSFCFLFGFDLGIDLRHVQFFRSILSPYFGFISTWVGWLSQNVRDVLKRKQKQGNYDNVLWRIQTIISCIDKKKQFNLIKTAMNFNEVIHCIWCVCVHMCV